MAFEVSNVSISRRGVCRVVKAISGARLTVTPKFFSWFRQETFCEFELEGGCFVAEEPYVDNSRYWIGRNAPGWHPAFFKVVTAFEQARPRWLRFGA